MLAPTDTLTVDTSMIASWRSDTAYDYNRELMQSDFNLMDWLLEQIGRFFDALIGSGDEGDVRTVIWIVVGIVALGLVAYFFFYHRARLFSRRSAAAAVDYDITEDTIYGIDFALAIDRALQSDNYREALRLIYLQTLKRLSDEGRIDWQPYKTPTQYIAEAGGSPFSEFTNHFLRVRYGGFDADLPLVERMRALQREIEKGGGHEE
ncbi:MAG: DUF4129 domain-containing protein [Prevotella sp.]|nr:DUF4129 domain-containing protein [Prevotella sp.]